MRLRQCLQQHVENEIRRLRKKPWRSSETLPFASSNHLNGNCERKIWMCLCDWEGNPKSGNSLFFLFMFLSVCKYTTLLLQSPEECARCLEPGVIDSSEAPCGCWELDPHSIEVFLTIDPCLWSSAPNSLCGYGCFPVAGITVFANQHSQFYVVLGSNPGLHGC